MHHSEKKLDDEALKMEIAKKITAQMATESENEDVSVYEDNDDDDSDELSDLEGYGGDCSSFSKQISGYKLIKQLEDTRNNQSGDTKINGR